MILQSLYHLHDRLAADPDAYSIAPEGQSLQKVTFFLELDPAKKVWEIRDYQDRSGNKPVAKPLLVLGGAKPPGAGISPCFLWDNTGYLLGYKKDDSKPERTIETFEASRDFHLSLESEINDEEFSLLCRCFENWRPEMVANFPQLDEIVNGFGVFQIRGVRQFLHQSEKIKAWWEIYRNKATDSEQVTQRCLITGDQSKVAELHEPKIKNVKDAQGAGALIVSFNADAYESFGKKSGANAPVSGIASQRYCKALNALLSSKKHLLQIGDATTVFWTGEPTETESILSDWLSDEASEDTSAQDKGLRESLENSLRSVMKGQPVTAALADSSNTPFYLLGLTGQAGGRIGVRFWYDCSLGDFVEKLASHHSALQIERQWGEDSKRPDPEFPRIWQLLRQTGREAKDIPPNLSGALMRSILDGTPYPQMLANNVINRIRADREINYLRASILKAWLTRLPNSNLPNLTMTYDNTNPEIAYRLGALFALLEKTQQDALGDLNAGIRDRFYSSASATPASVFPRLMRTYQHHLSKAGAQNKGYKIHREREVQSILAEPSPFTDFPNHLNLKEQGLFAIGFYHKRTDLWKKKETSEDSSPK